MNVGVVAATEYELAGLDLDKNKVNTYVLGVGSLQFGLALQSMVTLQAQQHDLLILIGMAGAAGGKHSLGECVCIQNDVQGDVGAFENGHFSDLVDLKLITPTIAYENFNQYNHPLLTDLTFAQSITVNSVTEDKHINQLRLGKYHASVENMEGAAFHLLCNENKIPFLHLRGISNYIGERDKSKWKLDEAKASYQALTKKIVSAWN